MTETPGSDGSVTRSVAFDPLTQQAAEAARNYLLATSTARFAQQASLLANLPGNRITAAATQQVNLLASLPGIRITQAAAQLASYQAAHWRVIDAARMNLVNLAIGSREVQQWRAVVDQLNKLNQDGRLVTILAAQERTMKAVVRADANLADVTARIRVPEVVADDTLELDLSQILDQAARNGIASLPWILAFAAILVFIALAGAAAAEQMLPADAHQYVADLMTLLGNALGIIGIVAAIKAGGKPRD